MLPQGCTLQRICLRAAGPFQPEVWSPPAPKQDIGDTGRCERRHEGRRVSTDTPGTHEQLFVPAEATRRAKAAAALSAISSPRGAAMNSPVRNRAGGEAPPPSHKGGHGGARRQKRADSGHHAAPAEPVPRHLAAPHRLPVPRGPVSTGRSPGEQRGVSGVRGN